ncbi:MAG: endonuclease domain-containing protein [Eubacteriales bacterium]
MIYNYNKKLIPNAQTLRKNMTAEEKHLWYDFFKKLPVTVNRQKNIGNYIVDFFISNNRIVIELDGSQHGMTENRKADEKRDSDLHHLGITVLRYTNLEINNNFINVCEDILNHLGLRANELNNGDKR